MIFFPQKNHESWKAQLLFFSIKMCDKNDNIYVALYYEYYTYHKRKAADIKKTIICSSGSDFCWVVVFFFIGSRSAEQCKSWLQPLCKSFFLKRKVEATKAIIEHSLALEVRREFKKNLNKNSGCSFKAKVWVCYPTRPNSTYPTH